MPNVDLSFAIGLAPEDAIQYFKDKGFAFSWNWNDIWQDAHATAFTVAKAMKLDILQDIRKGIDSAISNGQTLDFFRENLQPFLKAKGWWGKVDGAQLGSPHRLETIFRTNIQTAYSAGRYKQQIGNIDNDPYWQYLAVMDDRTRPAHMALHGKVFKYDDPFWDTHYPPIGFMCRCRVRALTQKQVKDRGVTVEDGTDRMVWEDQPVNSAKLMRPVAGYQDPITNKTIFTDPGWSNNPGKTKYQPDYGKILEGLKPKTEWQYIPGTQGGSNPGGIFMAPDGKKYYGKIYSNPDQARCEHLSYQIMDKLGIGGAKTQLKMMEWEGKQRLIVMSEWMDNAVPLNKLMGTAMTDAEKTQLIKHYLNAALTNNWDFVGLDRENLVRVGKKWIQVDAGGSFNFRAMGGKKEFGMIADSFETLLNPQNKPSAFYKPFLHDTLAADAGNYEKWLKSLSDSKIKKLVKEVGADPSFVKTLISRRDDLVKRVAAIESEKVAAVKMAQAAAEKVASDKVIAELEQIKADQAAKKAIAAKASELGISVKKYESILHKEAVAAEKAAAKEASRTAKAINPTKDTALVKQFMGGDYDLYKKRYHAGGIMTETEYVIAKGYTGNNHYPSINGSLIRNHGEPYSSGRQIEKDTLAAVVRQMNGALDKLPKPDQSQVWRGINLREDFIRKKFVPGAEVVMPGYQSCSIDSNRAYQKNVKITFNLKGKRGGLVNKISDYQSEQEFIFKTNLKFKVKSIEEYSGRFYITLDEMD